MVFPSAQDYLDPPNWNQQIQQQGGGGGSGVEVQPRHEGGIQGMVRPASMADRARLAKLPQPEQAVKCPRCDSTNTKFCYYNNYSLSQPRHFCKTCRRYWTRGGALRNIPVGGGCRRNKRSKSGGGSSSKSQSSTSTTPSSSSGAIMPIIPSGPPQLQFMGSLQAMGDYAGLNFPGIQSIDGVDYHVGGSGGSSVEMEPWRLQQIQQFPNFMGGLEATAPAPVQAMYSFDGEGGGAGDGGMYSGQMHSKAASAGLITQLASVKMEDSPHALNLRRQYLGFPARNDQYWSGGGNVGGGSSGGWITDLSGFNSSGHGNLL